MSPKPRDAVPKALSDVLKLTGPNPTTNSIKGLPDDIRKRAFSALSHHLKTQAPEMFEEYKQCGTNNDRQRQWLVDFAVDPKCGLTRVKQSDTRSASTQEKGREYKVTKEMLAGPRFLNSAEMADILWLQREGHRDQGVHRRVRGAILGELIEDFS